MYIPSTTSLHDKHIIQLTFFLGGKYSAETLRFFAKKITQLESTEAWILILKPKL